MRATNFVLSLGLSAMLSAVAIPAMAGNAIVCVQEELYSVGDVNTDLVSGRFVTNALEGAGISAEQKYISFKPAGIFYESTDSGVSVGPVEVIRYAGFAGALREAAQKRTPVMIAFEDQTKKIIQMRLRWRLNTCN